MVEVFSAKQSNIFWTWTSEQDLLYQSKGILQNRKHEQVVYVRHIAILRDRQALPIKHIILTFNSPNLPHKIDAAYLSLSYLAIHSKPSVMLSVPVLCSWEKLCNGLVVCALWAEFQWKIQNPV